MSSDSEYDGVSDEEYDDDSRGGDGGGIDSESESESESSDSDSDSDGQQDGQASVLVAATSVAADDNNEEKRTFPTEREYETCKPGLWSNDPNPDVYKTDLSIRKELRRRGKSAMKRAKTHRALIRKKYPNEASYPRPLPSSEDESDMDQSVDEEDNVFPRFRELSKMSRVARTSIYADMTIFSIDQAIGWAHHQSTDGGDYVEERQLPTPNLLLDAATMSNSPLPVSILTQIGDKFAKCKPELATTPPGNMKTAPSPAQPVARLPARKTKAAPKKRPKRKRSKNDDTTKAEQPARKGHSNSKSEGEVVWKDTMDFSAKVGVGMLVEEMITASLLPLAKLHTARCRSLPASQAFHEWTLPPNEAIHKLRNHPDVVDAAGAFDPALSQHLKAFQGDDE